LNCRSIAPGNRTRRADPVVVATADAVCVDRATRAWPVLRRYAEIRYAAKSTGDSAAHSLGTIVRTV